MNGNGTNVSRWGEPITMRRTWTIYLVNDQGYWIYDRWFARQENFDLMIEDVIYGLETGIMEVPEGEVITVVEEVT